MEDQISAQTPTATQQIYDYIDQYLGRKELGGSINRASAASQCYLKRWYQKEGLPGEALTARVIVNFTLGDLTEHTVKYFISKGCVGPGKLYSEVDFGNEMGRFTIQNGKEIVLYDQPEDLAMIGGYEVTAHADGYGKRNSDGCWELIEVKSAADFGFEEFKEAGPGDYMKQAMVNLQTERAIQRGAIGVRFFYLKKNTGHLWDRYFVYDSDLADEIEKDYKLSNQKERPPIKYQPRQETLRGKPTGREVLVWQCAYCSYNKECFPEAQIEFKSGKPIYVIKQKETA